ncbi:T7SS effector LXG polymorphic toxin [Metabacillus lacus]|nr:T7SS effector LXG polymorphic toxin [Metabacillus lacus]
MSNQRVSIEEVHAFYEEQSSINKEIREKLNRIKTNIDSVQNLNSFKGQTAEAAKAFFTEYHGTMLDAFQGLFAQLDITLAAHIQAFYDNVDSSEQALLNRDYIEDQEEQIGNYDDKLEGIAKGISQQIESVADITSASAPSAGDMRSSADDTLQVTTNLKRHYNQFTNSGKGDLSSIQSMMEEISALLYKARNGPMKTRSPDWFSQYLPTIQMELAKAKSTPAFTTLLSVKNVEPAEVQGESWTTQEHLSEERYLKSAQRWMDTLHVVNPNDIEMYFSEAYQKVKRMPLGSPYVTAVKYATMAFVESNIRKDMRNAKIKMDILAGIKTGVGNAFTDMWDGLVYMGTNPEEFINGIIHSILHPVDTVKIMWDGLTESWERDVVNGDAKSRAEWFSYALTNIAVSVVGTKGVDKVATSVKLPNLKVEKRESQTQTVMQPALAGVPGSMNPFPFNVLDSNAFW